ncbi:group II intron maturase-specific domain-containing protein [Bacillus aquiflavi]|nr:group II intron maturase-specific domain-containing protein [Bacillus aquiflavi]
MDIKELVKGLNRRLQGFKNYYQLSPMSKRWLNRIDWYVLQRF